MKLLADFLPVILFFVAYKVADIYVATGVAIVAAIVHISYLKLSKQRIKPVHWIALVFILVFGSLTIILKDEYWIKVKWTLYYGLMSGLILIATFMDKNPIRAVLGSEIELPAEAWKRFSYSWGWFFLVLAGLNHYFASTLSLDAWVSVKVIGGTVLMIAFIVGQGFWLAKYFPDDEPSAIPSPQPSPKGEGVSVPDQSAAQKVS